MFLGVLRPAEATSDQPVVGSLVFVCEDARSISDEVSAISRRLVPGDMLGVFETGLQAGADQALSTDRIYVCGWEDEATQPLDLTYLGNVSLEIQRTDDGDRFLWFGGNYDRISVESGGLGILTWMLQYPFQLGVDRRRAVSALAEIVMTVAAHTLLRKIAPHLLVPAWRLVEGTKRLFSPGGAGIQYDDMIRSLTMDCSRAAASRVYYGPEKDFLDFMVRVLRVIPSIIFPQPGLSTSYPYGDLMGEIDFYTLSDVVGDYISRRSTGLFSGDGDGGFVTIRGGASTGLGAGGDVMILGGVGGSTPDTIPPSRAMDLCASIVRYWIPSSVIAAAVFEGEYRCNDKVFGMLSPYVEDWSSEIPALEPEWLARKL